MAMSSFSLKNLTDCRDYRSIAVGNSVFTDDVWDISPYILSKTTRNSRKHLRFGYIRNDHIKHTVKLYAYYKLGQIKPQSVENYINNTLPRFIKFCSIREIHSFREVTREVLLAFAFWQKTEARASNSVMYRTSFVVEDIIRIGQMMDWEVPESDVLRGITSADLWKPEKNKDTCRTRPIPDDVFDKILECAINKEKNILTRAGIIIQSQTGMRISEVLSIQYGCVHESPEGISYMEIKTEKTEKGEPILHKIFVNELVKEVIRELEGFTEKLREQSGMKELFISQGKSEEKAAVCKADRFTSRRLTPFIKRWNIRDHQGNLYPLRSHQFRATFVKKLILQKIPIAYVMKQYSHVSIEMTWHYLTLREEEVREIYSQMILSPEARIAGIKADVIKGKLDAMFKGKTEREVDSIIRNLSGTMSFQPLPNGMCLYDYRRGNCTDGDGCFFYNCPNYVTEVSFLPILRKELNVMEKEMERSRMLGMERQWQRQYVKYSYLKPLVSSLEEQASEKE